MIFVIQAFLTNTFMSVRLTYLHAHHGNLLGDLYGFALASCIQVNAPLLKVLL